MPVKISKKLNISGAEIKCEKDHERISRSRNQNEEPEYNKIIWLLF